MLCLWIFQSDISRLQETLQCLSDQVPPPVYESLQEILRKAKGNNNNTTQLAQDSHFSKKNWLPEKPTTISSYQLSYRGSSVGWARILYTNHKASQPDTQVNSNLILYTVQQMVIVHVPTCQSQSNLMNPQLLPPHLS